MGIGICHIFTEEMGFESLGLRITNKIRDWNCDLGFEQNVSWKMVLNRNDRVLYTHSTSAHPGPSVSKGE